jgi:hypothetical protein
MILAGLGFGAVLGATTYVGGCERRAGGAVPRRERFARKSALEDGSYSVKAAPGGAALHMRMGERIG